MRRLLSPCLLLLATAVLPAADLRPGETAGPGLLTLADLHFAGDPAGGGTVELAGGAIRLSDTTAGKQTNLASRLSAPLAADAPLIARINQVLAAPAGGDPVWFACAFDVRRAAAAAKLIGMSIQLEASGGKRPWAGILTGDTDLRRVPGYVDGAKVTVDAGALPTLRFAVVPGGGAQRIDGLTLHVGIRIETGSSPETIELSSFTVRELAATPHPASGPRLGWAGSALPVPWMAAADRLGWRISPQRDDWSADAIVLDGRLDEAPTVARALEALDRGATLVVGLGTGGTVDPRLAERLPCNPWPWRSPNLRRREATAGDGLVFASRWDLHLPDAPIEEGLHRYLWSEYDKPLANTDWRTLLKADGEGGLPLLIAGRSGPGRVLVLATGIADAGLLASPGLEACATSILQQAKPEAPAPATAVMAAMVTIARHQTGALHAEIANPGTAPLAAVIAYQVSAWSRALLAKASVQVVVPAKGSLSIPLTETGSPRVDDGLALRRVRVAVLTADRAKTIGERTTVVSTAAPVALRIEEDPTGYEDLRISALTLASETWLDGRLATRTVYRPGAELSLALVVANGLTQLAPLATAQDLQWPENPTVGGLNDLSYSQSSLRETLPLQGAWSGRSAAEQAVALHWEVPVTVAGYRLVGQGSLRRWDRSNPVHHRVLAAGKQLAATDAAAFPEKGLSQRIASYDAPLPPTVTDALELRVTGLDKAADIEPRNTRPANCTLLEWECLGWPEASAPPAASGTLTAVLVDPVAGTSTEVLRQEVAVAALAQEVRALRVVLPKTPGPARVDVRFTGAGIDASASFPVVIIADGAPAIVAKSSLSDKDWGLLCSPGFVAAESFGTGMRSQTQGWGGDDDKIWAGVRNLMEVGDRNSERPETLFAFDAGFTHYTNPWRSMPNGRYAWEWEAERLRAKTPAGARVHIVGSDRWNGIPIGMTWGWGELIAFDEHLRAAGGAGLAGRTRGELTADVREHHGDAWQRWSLERYADALIKTQDDFKADGKSFTFETHGSFPVCGGDLGAKLAQTHIAVGTDVFWDLHDQDLMETLGSRFGVIAMNPDLRSGAYGQWGWDNSEMNRWWFANNGGPETARRQWLATYFLGRVDLSGTFAPYTLYGFGSQGDVGTKMHPADIAAFNRTALETTRLRPEQATGFGLVASWAAQERRMGPKLGATGFGLMPVAGAPDALGLYTRAYRDLALAGLPIGFVTSTQALVKWQGDRPLVQVDAYGLAGWELDALQRLNAAGAPLLALGADGPLAAPAQAARLFGAAVADGVWTAAPGVERVVLPGGAPAFVRAGRAPVVFCPLAGDQLPPRAYAALARLILERTGKPLRLPVGMACTPFVSGGSLYLALTDHGDADRTAEIEVDPHLLLASLDGRSCVAVDVDGARRLPTKTADGRLRITLEMPASGGRLLLITGGRP